LSVIKLLAQQIWNLSVSGIIIEKPSNIPLEFVNIIIRNNADSSKFQGTVTGSKRIFIFNKPFLGDYTVIYSSVGFKKIETPVFVLTSKQSKKNLGGNVNKLIIK
jgi:hypothetical protein